LVHDISRSRLADGRKQRDEMTRLDDRCNPPRLPFPSWQMQRHRQQVIPTRVNENCALPDGVRARSGSEN
jgi:hypothetical protein